MLLDGGGVVNDRVFVLVGADGKHITQREAPQLATVATSFEPGFTTTDLNGALQTLAIVSSHRVASVPVFASRKPPVCVSR